MAKHVKLAESKSYSHLTDLDQLHKLSIFLKGVENLKPLVPNLGTVNEGDLLFNPENWEIYRAFTTHIVGSSIADLDNFAEMIPSPFSGLIDGIDNISGMGIYNIIQSIKNITGQFHELTNQMRNDGFYGSIYMLKKGYGQSGNKPPSIPINNEQDSTSRVNGKLIMVPFDMKSGRPDERNNTNIRRIYFKFAMNVLKKTVAENDNPLALSDYPILIELDVKIAPVTGATDATINQVYNHKLNITLGDDVFYVDVPAFHKPHSIQIDFKKIGFGSNNAWTDAKLDLGSMYVSYAIPTQYSYV